MISRYIYKNLTWIDLESPTKDEVRQIMDEYDIHPVVANELLTPTVRPKVDLYENIIYLILHFPTVAHQHEGHTEQEVDFIIGRNFFITTHYELVDPLYEFSKVFEVSSILDKSNLGDHGGFLFFYVVKELYRNLESDLDVINDRLERIEEKIFEGGEVRMVETISKTNRDLLNFRQSIRHHGAILESFEAAGKKFFGQDFEYYLRSVTGEYYKVANILDGHKETLVDLRETNDSLLTTRTNEIMKFLTIIAFITFPLALIASLFGMNTIATPIVGSPGDFWVVMGMMLFATLAMFAFFKLKRWI